MCRASPISARFRPARSRISAHSASAATCPKSSSVHLTVQSEHGALQRDGGAETVAYQAAWDIQGRSDDYGDASAAQSPLSFTLNSGAPGSTQSGMYKIKITGPTNALVAGTYRDTITYTITP